MNELREFTLRLSLCQKIGPKKIKQLLDRYYSIEGIFLNYSKDLFFAAELAKIDLSVFLCEIQKRNIKYICFWEKEYPLLLKECNDFPIIIYYVGNSELLINNEWISIVGTRKITFYGKKILDSGNLVISEMPPGNSSHNGLFPRRNRIIAGLSSKTVVIEAGVKSGALITADLAFNYNREVFAYPGNINSCMSMGCNYLIKNNVAQLIESPADLGLNSKDMRLVLKLNPIERQIYYAILAGQKSLNGLSKALNLDIQFISEICTNLEINGILNTDNQNQFYVS